MAELFPFAEYWWLYAWIVWVVFNLAVLAIYYFHTPVTQGLQQLFIENQTAAAILATSDDSLAARLDAWREQQTGSVVEAPE